MLLLAVLSMARLSSLARSCPSPPHPLSSTTDRYAVSVLWTLDADSFEVQDVWFGRTLIRQAQAASRVCCIYDRAWGAGGLGVQRVWFGGARYPRRVLVRQAVRITPPA